MRRVAVPSVAIYACRRPSAVSGYGGRDLKRNITSGRSLPAAVRIVEVGPRDGLQNEQAVISVDTKVRLIELLAESGLKSIEVGSFVSKKWVPQMADSDKVYELAASSKIGALSSGSVALSALTPNLVGLEAALKAGVKEIAVFGAASESFSKKNINCSVDESMKRFSEVCSKALAQGLRVRGYVSCVLGCPYEGHVEPQKVLEVTQALLAMGCYEVSLGDTIGVGTAGSTAALLTHLAGAGGVPVDKLAVHFHDTYGQSLANIYVALHHGVSVVDSSVSGLGGCPYAAGASGNVATEDVVYMLHGLGIKTGVDPEKLLAAAQFVDAQLGRSSGSKVTLAALARRKKTLDASKICIR